MRVGEQLKCMEAWNGFLNRVIMSIDVHGTATSLSSTIEYRDSPFERARLLRLLVGSMKSPACHYYSDTDTG